MWESAEIIGLVTVPPREVRGGIAGGLGLRSLQHSSGAGFIPRWQSEALRTKRAQGAAEAEPRLSLADSATHRTRGQIKSMRAASRILSGERQSRARRRTAKISDHSHPT